MGLKSFIIVLSLSQLLCSISLAGNPHAEQARAGRPYVQEETDTDNQLDGWNQSVELLQQLNGTRKGEQTPVPRSTRPSEFSPDSLNDI
ncbi:MAG: hypothetical protein H6617_08410 [Bdellovibrionaceae bacterium]|nr:hypothetical protein [Bdellovibrionales bacterium]MCB9254689.1 hypothetical protein [Pseudobdellovibrionaceae bacterium]